MTEHTPAEAPAAIEPAESAEATAAIETAESAAPASDPTTAPALRPRTRWAGIVWGLALAALAAAGVWLASEPGRLDDLVAWMRELSAVTAIGYGILVVGALLLVTGLVGLLRRAQRAMAARSTGA